MRRSVPALLLTALAATGCGSQKAVYQHFESRPDLVPPAIEVTTPARATAPGYVFIAPKHDVVQAGPMIFDNTGQPVWFHPLDTHGVADFREQTYRGKPVLTWWRGKAAQGVGVGYDVIADSSYRVIAKVYAGNGLVADIHEFQLTPRGTALITVYHKVPLDLSKVGGPKDGAALEGVVQEIDVATGKVLFAWHSLAHVGIAESYLTPPPADKGAAASPYDYFHVNSVDEDADGNLLVSARNTHALYKIDRATGAIVWRLGGKKSDFTMGQGTSFGWQHNARWRPDGTISLFDNEATPPLSDHSRALVLRIDEQSKRVELDRSYSSPDGLLSGSQGNIQFLPNGNVFVGWGANPYVTEFSADGRTLFDAHFKQGADSYRAFRFAWIGRPTDPPALAVRTDRRGRVTAYASWNGATRVVRWRVLAGADGGHLRWIASAPKNGFETAVDLGYLLDHRVVLQALGADGEVLGTSSAETRPPR